MPAEPCTNHPKEMTLVRCGRCDAPFCLRCLIDTPVGKKCRPCADNRTHLTESHPGGVAAAYLVALALSFVGMLVIGPFTGILLLAGPFGYAVAECALRAGKRSRSLAMQVAVGVATLAGGLMGSAILLEGSVVSWQLPGIWDAAFVVIGTSIAVGRVRFI